MVPTGTVLAGTMVVGSMGWAMMIAPWWAYIGI